MTNHMMAMTNDDRPGMENQKPFPKEAERADAFTIENDEIGLLDIVFMDAIAKGEACNQ